MKNWIGFPIVYIVKDNKGAFYKADVEYWIVEWWDGYVNLELGQLENLYFDFIQKFRLDFNDLKRDYNSLNDEFSLRGNRPLIFIDLDNKIFISNYFEQSLEKRLLGNWEGYWIEDSEVFCQKIPKKLRYWESTLNTESEF